MPWHSSRSLPPSLLLSLPLLLLLPAAASALNPKPRLCVAVDIEPYDLIDPIPLCITLGALQHHPAALARHRLMVFHQGSEAEDYAGILSSCHYPEIDSVSHVSVGPLSYPTAEFASRRHSILASLPRLFDQNLAGPPEQKCTSFHLLTSHFVIHVEAKGAVRELTLPGHGGYVALDAYVPPAELGMLDDPQPLEVHVPDKEAARIATTKFSRECLAALVDSGALSPATQAPLLSPRSLPPEHFLAIPPALRDGACREYTFRTPLAVLQRRAAPPDSAAAALPERSGDALSDNSGSRPAQSDTDDFLLRRRAAPPVVSPADLADLFVQRRRRATASDTAFMRRRRRAAESSDIDSTPFSTAAAPLVLPNPLAVEQIAKPVLPLESLGLGLHSPIPLASASDQMVRTSDSGTRLCVVARTYGRYGSAQVCAFTLSVLFADPSARIYIVYNGKQSEAEEAERVMREQCAAAAPLSAAERRSAPAGFSSFLDVSAMHDAIPPTGVTDYGYLITNVAVNELLERGGGEDGCDYFMVTNMDNYYFPSLSRVLQPKLREGIGMIAFDFVSHYTMNAARAKFRVGAIDLGAVVLSRECVERFLKSAPGGLFRPSPDFVPTKPVGCGWQCADGQTLQMMDKSGLCSTHTERTVLFYHQ